MVTDQQLAELIHRESQRRLNSEPIIREFLGNPSFRGFRVIDWCDFCGSRNISAICNRDRYGAPIRAAQCVQCGLIFLVDRMSEDDYAQFYEDVYRPLVSAYLGRTVNAETIQAEQLRYAENLAAALRDVGGLGVAGVGGKLLDVGGSTGLVASLFAKQFNCSATVLDPSREELDIAKQRGLRTVHGLLEGWEPPQGERFEFVFCCKTIDHFLDLRKSLDKLKELTKPQGRVVIDIIDFDVIWKKKRMVEAAIKIDHCYYLSSENAPHILRNAGLQVVYSEIASNFEHVSYVCRASDPVDVPVDLSKWAAARLRAIQCSRVHLDEARAIPRNKSEWVRRKLYSLKRSVMPS